MKELKVKTIEMKAINGTGENAKFDYKDMIEIAVKKPPEKGFQDLSVMKKRLAILEKCEKANGKLSLEDAEAEELKKCVEDMTWTILDPAIVQFIDDVKGM